MNCTFGGVWNGGGGDGQKRLFVASFFFDRAAEVLTCSNYPRLGLRDLSLSNRGFFHMQAGFVDPKKPSAKVKPSEFEDAAKHACALNLEEAKKIYPRVEEENLPYLCMDLVYQYTLLIDGFGMFFFNLQAFLVIDLGDYDMY